MSVSARCTEVLMAATTIDATMSENACPKLSDSLSECMPGSGIVGVIPSDVVSQCVTLDPGPQVNPPLVVSARCADHPMPEAACDPLSLRLASLSSSMLGDENASACDMQPSDGPMGQWSGCTNGQTVSAQGDTVNTPNCGLTQGGNPSSPTASRPHHLRRLH